MSAPAPLPRVDGRHRNRALAAARRARAVELRTQGWTYDAIATELGYADRGTVFHIVGKALIAQQTQAVDQLRLLETQRLDAVQAGIWDKAMAGDVPATQAAIRIITARCRLLGLDQVALDEHSRQPRTVVVPPSQ